jgi:Flp pilus assembly protein TadG
MKKFVTKLARSREGAASIEFIVAAPFLILLLVGILQLGILFLAKAGLEQAVESGARFATIFPRPTDAEISARVLASGYGMNAAGISGPTLTYGESGGSPYVDITMTYTVRPNFIFFTAPPVELQHTRRAFQV